MVKISSVFVTVLGMAAMGEACKRTCSAVSETSGTCTYNCTDQCSSLPAGTARDNFLNALKSSGYSCTSSGVTGVKCNKGGSFGTNCWNHYWTCGSGC
jgi:hypothetical protein